MDHFDAVGDFVVGEEFVEGEVGDIGFFAEAFEIKVVIGVFAFG